MTINYTPDGKVDRGSGYVGYDRWLLEELTDALDRANENLRETDLQLSHVLHECAGAASMCWKPRPTGVFDSEEAITHVEHAIGELRTILRDNGVLK